MILHILTLNVVQDRTCFEGLRHEKSKPNLNTYKGVHLAYALLGCGNQELNEHVHSLLGRSSLTLAVTIYLSGPTSDTIQVLEPMTDRVNKPG